MSASGTIYLTISALIYTIITTILFQRKKKIKFLIKEGTMKMAHLIFSILTLLMITKL